MKIRTIAFNTFGSFLRNRVILLFTSIFICIVLLMMAPLMSFKTITTAANAQEMQGFVLNEIAMIISMVSGFGSLLAAWAAADAVATELTSGTILAVMARPLRRWEFLAGKYLGVLMLMAIYVFALLGLTFLLAWIGGQHFHTAVWTVLIYPFVRYALWAAISLLLVTFVHPVLVMGIVAVLATLIQIFASSASHIPVWLRSLVHHVLPMTNLLSEQRFLMITRASLKPFVWSQHLLLLAYGLDYALVCFLLALFFFQRRGLARD